MITTDKRQQVEENLIRERRILQQCVYLLKDKIPLSEWPYDVKVAFLLAIRTEGEGREAYKAFSASRHLRLRKRLPDDDIPKHPSPLQYRCSERIRADLSRLVKLGAGSYL